MSYKLTLKGAALCLSVEAKSATEEQLKLTRCPQFDSHRLCADNELAFHIDHEELDRSTVASVVFLRPEHYTEVVDDTQYHLTESGFDILSSLTEELPSSMVRIPEYDSHDLCEEGERAFQLVVNHTILIMFLSENDFIEVS